MDEGRIVAWHKRVGDAVAAGDVLFEVETDKATMEVESPTAGTLRRILYPADATAPVATVVALITDTPDELVPTDDSFGAGLPKPSLRDEDPPASGRAPVARGPSEVQPLPSSTDGERVRSSPAARKRAQELGVDIGSIPAGGPRGRPEEPRGSRRGARAPRGARPRGQACRARADGIRPYRLEPRDHRHRSLHRDRESPRGRDPCGRPRCGPRRREGRRASGTADRDVDALGRPSCRRWRDRSALPVGPRGSA